MTTRRKPTLNEKIAAWKSAKDIVLDELITELGRRAGPGRLSPSDSVALVAEASRTAALMAPWNSEEED